MPDDPDPLASLPPWHPYVRRIRAMTDSELAEEIERSSIALLDLLARLDAEREDAAAVADELRTGRLERSRVTVTSRGPVSWIETD